MNCHIGLLPTVVRELISKLLQSICSRSCSTTVEAPMSEAEVSKCVVRNVRLQKGLHLTIWPNLNTKRATLVFFSTSKWDIVCVCFCFLSVCWCKWRTTGLSHGAACICTAYLSDWATKLLGVKRDYPYNDIKTLKCLFMAHCAY